MMQHEWEYKGKDIRRERGDLRVEVGGLKGECIQREGTWNILQELYERGNISKRDLR